MLHLYSASQLGGHTFTARDSLFAAFLVGGVGGVTDSYCVEVQGGWAALHDLWQPAVHSGWVGLVGAWLMGRGLQRDF